MRALPGPVLGERRRVRQLECERDALHTLFDALPVGAILLDDSLHVIWANPFAAALLDENDGLSIRQGRLCGSHAGQMRSLRGFLCTAAQAGAGGTPAGLASFPRPSGRRALEILVVHLARGEAPQEPAARFALLVSDPESAPALSPHALGVLYGLTQAEARVATRLASGDSTRRIAESMRVQENTVRWHLKQIYAKTSTHGQGDLLRRLLGGVASWAEMRRSPRGREGEPAQRAAPSLSAVGPVAAPILRCSTPPNTE